MTPQSSGDADLSGLTPDAQKVVRDQPTSTANPEDKVSLDATMNRYQNTQVQLKDDTGKTRLICRSMMQTGTLIKKKICYTPEEWDAWQSRAKEEARQYQRRNTILPCDVGQC